MDRLTAYLQEQREAALAELRRTVPLAMAALADMDDAEWEALGRELLDAAQLLVDASTMLRRPPATTICVCQYCKKVFMPTGPIWDTYGHCGRLLMARGSVPLPADFWEHYLPGDEYRGLIVAEWARLEQIDERSQAAVERSKKGQKSAPAARDNSRKTKAKPKAV